MFQSLHRFVLAFYRTIVEALFPLSQAENEMLALTPREAIERLRPAPILPVSDAHAIFAYKDERVSKMVWHIKYKKSLIAARIAGYALAQSIRADRGASAVPSRPIIVIPMPITIRRRRERGYNQCELVVREMEIVDKALGAPSFGVTDDLLLRTHHTSRQTLKDRADRLASAKGIFSVNEIVARTFLAEQPHIIIIDDVITTGSTIREAMDTLRAAGFEHVSGLSIAH